MKERQNTCLNRMIAENHKLLVAVLKETSPESAWLNLKIRPSKAALDRNLPQADYAEYKLMIVRQQQACGLWKALRYSSRPQQQMRIQKQLHSDP